MLILSCNVFAAETTEESGVVRFGVFSDTHNKSDGIQNVFNNIYALSENGTALDGVIMNGDIVYLKEGDTPSESHYATLLANEKYQALKNAGKIIYEMGNHEFPLNSSSDATLTQQSFDMFKAQTGFDPQMHTVLSDYHFINAAPESYSGGMAVNEEYMKTELDKALADGTEKPVFLVVHHPVPSSVIDSPAATSTRYSVEFREFLNNQPRIIVLTGHTHEPETDPRSIRQYIGGCTYVATSHVAGGSNVSSSYAVQSHSQKVTQALMMEIDPDTNVVTFKRFYVDKTAPEYLEAEDWVIDIPAMVAAKATETESDDLAAFKYTFEERSENSVAPVFPEGSKVTVDNVAAESVKLTFPKAIEGADGEDNLIKFYEMKITDLDSATVVKTEAIISDFFLKESERRSSFSHTITGLSQDTNYKIEVMATTSWYKKSVPISAEIMTLEKEKFESVTFDTNNTFTVAAENISNDNNSVYHRGSYIQVPNTASTHKFTATFNLKEKGMYRFMSGLLGSNGAPVTVVIKKVEENGDKTVIKTAEVYVATSGKYDLDIDDVTFLASNYSYRTGGLAEPERHRMVISASTTNVYNTAYDLKIGAGNYKVYGYFDNYTGNPDLIMSVDGTKIGQYSNTYASTVKEYELGTIHVTDEQFRLNFVLPKASSGWHRLYLHRFRLVKIDEPEVVMYKGQTTDLANVTTTLTEGSMTAKAYYPKEVNGTPVTMVFAIYEGNRLYKVGTYSVTGKKNSIAVSTIDDIEFKEGVNYTSKVMFINSTNILTPLYSMPHAGMITGALTTEE